MIEEQSESSAYFLINYRSDGRNDGSEDDSPEELAHDHIEPLCVVPSDNVTVSHRRHSR
jgi:hypothetical protein